MERLQLANEISKLTKTGTMLPKEPESVLQFMDSGDCVILWDNDVPIGFGAITFHWPNNFMEVGAVVVKEEKRGNGLGHKIVQDLIELAKTKYPDAKLFALCNDNSIKLFLDNNGEIINNPNDLPDEVWKECQNCPKFMLAKSQGKLCCDTPVLI